MDGVPGIPWPPACLTPQLVADQHKAPGELPAAPGTVCCTAILLGARESEATESGAYLSPHPPKLFPPHESLPLPFHRSSPNLSHPEQIYVSVALLSVG